MERKPWLVIAMLETYSAEESGIALTFETQQCYLLLKNLRDIKPLPVRLIVLSTLQ